MTTKDAFTAEEWTSLKTGILDAGRYLVLADPISKSDLSKEARAIGGYFSDLRSQAELTGLSNKLLQALVMDGDASEQSSDLTVWSMPNLASDEMANARSTTLANVGRAGTLLDAKATPEEAKDIKVRMYELAGLTAGAAKEGSFMGFGGVRVTLAEKAALEDIARVLSVNPADAASSIKLPGEEA